MKGCRLKRFFFISVAILFVLAISTVEIAFAQGGVALSAWPCRGHDSGRSGQSSNVGAQTNILNWRTLIGGRAHSSPAIGADGTVYIGSLDTKLYALWNWLIQYIDIL